MQILLKPYVLAFFLAPIVFIVSWLTDDSITGIGSEDFPHVLLMSLYGAVLFSLYALIVQGYSRLVLKVLRLPNEATSIFNSLIILSIVFLLILTADLLINPTSGDEFVVVLIPPFFIFMFILQTVAAVLLKLYLMNRSD